MTVVGIILVVATLVVVFLNRSHLFSSTSKNDDEWDDVASDD